MWAISGYVKILSNFIDSSTSTNREMPWLIFNCKLSANYKYLVTIPV